MVRLLIVGLVAALLGCVAAALVLVGSVDQFSFIPVPLLWLGSMLLLAPANALLRARRIPMPLRAVPLVGAGAAGFAGAGWLLSGGIAGSAVMGGVYGLVTAAIWAGLAALAEGDARRSSEG